MDRRDFLIRSLGVAVAPILSNGVLAQATDDAATYPSRPVKLIIPFTAGGTSDVLGRLVGEVLSEGLGQQFVVENPTGAGGSIGITAVARAKPDGYTLLVSTPSLVINPLLYANVKYDPLFDFEHIGLAWGQPFAVLVRKDAPYDTLAKLVAEARREPGKMKFGSAGVGGSNHLAGELFSFLADIKLTHVPYRGMAPAIIDVINGQIDIAFATTAALVTSRDQLRGLAIASSKRSHFTPDVPTSTEAGVPGWETNSWGGVLAPAGTPRAIVEKLSKVLLAGLAKPQVVEKFTKIGVDVQIASSEEFTAYIRKESEQAAGLIKSLGLKLE